MKQVTIILALIAVAFTVQAQKTISHNGISFKYEKFDDPISGRSSAHLRVAKVFQNMVKSVDNKWNLWYPEAMTTSDGVAVTLTIYGEVKFNAETASVILVGESGNRYVYQATGSTTERDTELNWGYGIKTESTNNYYTFQFTIDYPSANEMLKDRIVTVAVDTENIDSIYKLKKKKHTIVLPLMLELLGVKSRTSKAVAQD